MINTSGDTLTVVKNLLKDSLGGVINNYYEGDPLKIPNASLPCIIIERINSNINAANAPTGMDRYQEQIAIRVVLDKMADVGAGPSVDLTEKKLHELLEGWDSATGFFKTTSILYALRTNITLGSRIIEQNIDTNYDINPRPDMGLTSEGLISLIVTSDIIVPIRS